MAGGDRRQLSGEAFDDGRAEPDLPIRLLRLLASSVRLRRHHVTDILTVHLPAATVAGRWCGDSRPVGYTTGIDRRILFCRRDAARSSPVRCPPEVVLCQTRPGGASLAVPCHPARMASVAVHGRGTMCRAPISSAGIADKGEPAGPVAAHRPTGTAPRTHGLSARMREHA